MTGPHKNSDGITKIVTGDPHKNCDTLTILKKQEEKEQEKDKENKEKEISPQNPFIVKEIKEKEKEKEEKKGENIDLFPLSNKFDIPQGENEPTVEEFVEIEEGIFESVTNTSNSSKKTEKEKATKKTGAANSKKNAFTLEQRTQMFKESLFPYCETFKPKDGAQRVNVKQYPTEMVEDFFNYWSEPNQAGTKMRWEFQKTWSLSGRLAYWASNRKNQNFRNNEGRINGVPNREYHLEFIRRCEEYLGEDNIF